MKEKMKNLRIRINLICFPCKEILPKCRVAEPEPPGAGLFGWSRSWSRKITKFRLRLLVNFKAANYEFLTTKKKLFSSLIQNYRMYMFDFRNNFLYQGRKQGFGSAFFCGSGSWGFRGRGWG